MSQPTVERMGTVDWTLPAREVHVWRASLECSGQGVARMRRLLTADERGRADRFRFERHRSRYIVGRGLLRVLLGRYLECAPEHLRLQYGAYDKPHLASPGPWFNLSHSGSVVLYVLTRVSEVGIDVELDSADLARERVAERFFSPGEVAALRSLPESLQPRAFLTCWTRKEAFIKARGDGLSLPLDSFDVSFAPGVPPALLRTAWSRNEPREWRVHDLSDRRAGYIAALALRSGRVRVVERQLPDNVEGLAPGEEDT